MQKTFLLSLLLLTSFIGIRAQDKTFGWYKVTESSNQTVWSKGTNIYIQPASGKDSFQLLGYSNQGGSVHAIIKGTKLTVPMQRSLIVPYGGFATLQWVINAEAEGTITDSTITMDFFFQKDGEGGYLGQLKAVKQKEEIGMFFKRDTVINGTTYHWLYKDPHERLTEIGQRYENNKRDGRWKFFDLEGVLQSEVIYRNDTLNGWATEYNDSGSEITTEEGMYLKGNKTGSWAVRKQISKRKWVVKFLKIFDIEGNLVSQTLTFNDGKPAAEIYYSKDGKAIWYRHFDEKGTIRQEGDAANILEKELMLQNK